MSCSSYKLRPLTVDDASVLAELTKAVWNRVVPLEHLRWKYSWPPDSERGWIVTDASGAAVAATGYWLRKLWIHGREIPAIMVVDMMSHPRHRGRVYLSIAEKVKCLASSFILYGFTNSVSNSYYRKFFARDLYFKISKPISRWITPLTPFGKSSPSRVFNRLYRFLFHTATFRYHRRSDHYVETLSTVDSWADELWARVKDEYSWIQYRGADYLSWRYCANPDRPYTIMRAIDRHGNTLGMMVTTLVGKGPRGYGMILDWMTPRLDTSVFDLLLRHALVTLVRQGASRAEAWLLEPGNAFARRLKRRLFFSRPSQRYYLVVTSDVVIDRRTIAPDDVFLTMGDTDYPGSEVEITDA